MRLNKYIAQSGVCSRRKADELTKNGNVKVNGLVILEMGYDVKPGDVVEVNGRIIEPVTKLVYYMLNKPKGYITSASDEKDRPTVMDLMTNIEERVFPVGRLDYNTTGLLLLTNDGDLANKLAHPEHEVGKTYRAIVSGILSDKRVHQLEKGVDIGGFVTSPAQVNVIKQTSKSAVCDITVHEGKYRQVRRMFKAVGCPVKELQRIAIGDLYLARLKEGTYRKLNRQEVEYLKGL